MSGSNSGDVQAPGARPAIVGDVVFGGLDSPVAVCTLASRSLLPALAGRPEIAVAGRVFTENVGVEKMVQNLIAFPSVRYLIVCGQETRHRVGQTILALHLNGIDAARRVVGSDAPEPIMPDLTAEQLQAFQRRIAIVDMIGEKEAEAIVARARELARQPVPPPVQGDQGSGQGEPPAAETPTAGTADEAPTAERVTATRDPASAWTYDPTGYFLVFVDRTRRMLRVEQHDQAHRLLRTIEGRGAEELCHTIVRLGQVTLLAHAAYLGRELAKAEAALVLELEYEQDRPLTGGQRRGGA